MNDLATALYRSDTFHSVLQESALMHPKVQKVLFLKGFRSSFFSYQMAFAYQMGVLLLGLMINFAPFSFADSVESEAILYSNFTWKDQLIERVLAVKEENMKVELAAPAPMLSRQMAVTVGQLSFPTIGIITQSFSGNHPALDIGNPEKPGVWAADAGTVILAKEGWNGGYGNYVKIDHGDGSVTLYAHLEEFYVTEGESVASGQVIGKMGNSGNTQGPTGIHLHFEVRQNGQNLNPSKYL